VTKSKVYIPALAMALAWTCAALTAMQAPPAPAGQAPAGAGRGAPAGGGQVPAPGGGRAGGLGAAPQRPAVDPAVLERGQGLYSVHCAFCHGSEARGGETGPNLLRSPVILEDQAGELLIPIVKSGRPERGMPARPDLTDSQIKDIAGLLRNLRTTGRDPGRNRPATIVVGNAAEGEAYFASTCAKCHSASGDLKGLASKYSEPRQLQQAWLAGTAAGGRGGPPVAAPKTTIAVTLPSGEVVKGEQARLDDFIVSLKLPDGSVRTFPRSGETPKLEIHDPLQPHRNLVPTYTDRDIHNLTAYLVTLK
jgi:cytochrome c oxidase cbb3-type subunit III